jgi:hypothetical protein
MCVCIYFYICMCAWCVNTNSWLGKMVQGRQHGIEYLQRQLSGILVVFGVRNEELQSSYYFDKWRDEPSSSSIEYELADSFAFLSTVGLYRITSTNDMWNNQCAK